MVTGVYEAIIGKCTENRVIADTLYRLRRDVGVFVRQSRRAFKRHQGDIPIPPSPGSNADGRNNLWLAVASPSTSQQTHGKFNSSGTALLIWAHLKRARRFLGSDSGHSKMYLRFVEKKVMTLRTENDRAAWLRGPSVNCKVVPQATQHAYRLVLLGAPGVGKGTQADLLNQALHACHLSTGDLFRAAARSGECAQSPAMRAALEYMNSGALVPDSTVWEMVRERRGCLHCGGGFILDGFPRTLAQAESLKQLMDHERLSLTAVICYQVPVSEIHDRLEGRRTCQNCKAVFHLTQRPSKDPARCDFCGGKLFRRDDDRAESIKVRLEAYERTTAPVIDFYRQLGLLLSVAAAGSPEEVCTRTISALKRF
jgi:adenylate kinase